MRRRTMLTLGVLSPAVSFTHKVQFRADAGLRIIKDFYLTETDAASKPRVFGMTASPIDAKSDVIQAANELETLLHSRIATTLDMSLTDAVKKPAEQVLRYSPLPQPFETKLLRSVQAQFGHVGVFRRVFETAPRVARELGSWCADRYLINAFSEKRLRSYEIKEERTFYARSITRDIKELDAKHSELRSAFDHVAREGACPVSDTVRSSDVSSRVLELQRFLACEFERESSHRCIVFVEQRYAARLLATLFEKIGTKYLRPTFLIGGNSTETGEDHFSFRQQALTLIKFRKGEYNCLFATSVAEEGLDVPDCNLVIRFDMYKTMIQYVQSRGRAHQQNSKFLHMIENGNSVHQQLLSEVRFQENTMRSFCQSLPEDRRLVGNEDSLEELLSKEKEMRVYTEPSTGAKLTYGNALVYLANFVSAIPTESDEPQHPTYVVSSQGSKFRAEVVLPRGAPMCSVTGRLCMRKTLAKRSAAFEACVSLRGQQYMDEHLMPIYQKKLPAMRNALLAVGMKNKNMYLMRTKPSIWEETRDDLPTELWMTIVDFTDGLERKYKALAFLTRRRMPDFPEFPIFLSDGRESTVTSRSLGESFRVDAQMIEKLSVFTFRVFLDVFSKTYEEDASKLSYWLAPANISPKQEVKGPPEVALDWPLLDEVFENDEYRWTPDTPNEMLVDKFLVDRWDGGRKLHSVRIDPDLRPLDPVPEDTVKARWNGNILEYSVSLWKKSREQAKWNQNQPVIEAEKFLARRNMLATPAPKEMGRPTRAFVCPEPLRISALPPAITASCLVWPAVIHRFESYLIAMETCEMVGVTCNPDVALAAVTKDSDNSGEHENETKVNFQTGMGENYERLEFIGDTFLKTATTISTFIQNPDDNEFAFHVKRMLLLCNKNLFGVAKKLKLYEYIRSMSFSRRLWYPEGLKLLAGKGVNKDEENSQIKHFLGEKTIADVCEALIGAAFVTHDKPGETWREEQWENAVLAVTKLVGSADHEMKAWNDYRLAYTKPAYQTGNVTASQRDLAEKVELEHPYRFTYPRLLRSSFTHPSQPRMYEQVPNYQRLEFLGDALLDMASITYLFYQFPGKDPQWLTEHKMVMVSNKFLGAVCVNIGFHKHLRYSPSILEHQIREYATELLEAKSTTGGSRDYWTTVSDPPKCLPDIIESYIGAMFVDSDFDYNVVQNFFDRNIKWYFEDMSLYDTFANDHPCTHLHNLLRTTYGCQDYRLMAKELPSADGVDSERKDIVAVVMVHDHIVSYTKGKSGRYARPRVATKAIEVIEGLVPYEFRSNFLCDCHVKGGGEQEQMDKLFAAELLPVDCNV